MNPLVSIIVPTKNSERFLEACLASIKKQTYPNVELIVVDNFSTDTTPEIARKFTNKVFSRGPERSAQRNFGVREAKGEYVLIIDSDMELSAGVVEGCVRKASENQEIAGIIIPEESFGEGFWAQCKRLERSFYVGVDWMEAARFFPTKIYRALDGYDEALVSGEDWDLSQRAAQIGKIDRIQDFIFHNEGRLSLFKTLKKKFYYAQHFEGYTSKNQKNGNLSYQTGILARYQLFFSRPKKIITHPLLWFGMFFMKTCEFSFGFFGILSNRKNI